MNENLKDMGLVESDTKVAEKGLRDEKNDALLRERLDNFLKVCFPTGNIGLFDWQKDIILKLYKELKTCPDKKIVFARASNKPSYGYYLFLATMFRGMYDESAPIDYNSHQDRTDDVRRILLVDETMLRRTDED